MEILEKLIQNFNLKKQFLILSFLEGIGFVVAFYDNSLPVIGVFLILNVITALWFGFRSAHRAEAIARNLQTIASGNLSKKFGLKGKDDFSWMAYESDSARRGVATLIQGVTDTSKELGHSADEMSSIALRTKDAIASQGEHTAQIASSIMQLASQVKEVSAQAVRVASSAKSANSAAVGGSKVVGETIRSLDTISHDVQGIAESITSLQDEINKISSVMQVIRDISEQTKLRVLVRQVVGLPWWRMKCVICLSVPASRLKKSRRSSPVCKTSHNKWRVQCRKSNRMPMLLRAVPSRLKMH